jgi:hypothetical protein
VMDLMDGMGTGGEGNIGVGGEWGGVGSESDPREGREGRRKPLDGKCWAPIGEEVGGADRGGRGVSGFRRGARE